MDHDLSHRELEVLEQAATGRAYAEIAGVLSVGRRTVHGHLQQIYRRLGVSNRTAAIAQVLRSR